MSLCCRRAPDGPAQFEYRVGVVEYRTLLTRACRPVDGVPMSAHLKTIIGLTLAASLGLAGCGGSSTPSAGSGGSGGPAPSAGGGANPAAGGGTAAAPAPAPAPAPAAGGHFCAIDESAAKKLLGDGPLDYAGGKSSGCQVRNKNKTGAVGSAAGMISFGVFLTANKDFAGERGFVQGDKLACPEKVFEDVSGLADKAFVSIPCWNATNKRGTVVMDKGGKLYFASISAEQALSLDASGAKAALLDVAKAVVTKF